MATRQSEERYKEQNGVRKRMMKPENLAQEIFLRGFKSAEDHFKLIGKEESVREKKKQHRHMPMIKDEPLIDSQEDEGWRRTLMQRKKLGTSLRSNDELVGRSKKGKKNDLKTFHFSDDQFAFPFNTSIFNRSSTFDKALMSSSSSSRRRIGSKHAINDDQNDQSKAKRNRRTAEEISDLRTKLPDDSLLEVLHHFSSLYYDKHQILYDTIHSLRKVEGKDDDNDEEKEEGKDVEGKTAQSRTEYGMLQACEGNALIAMAIYLEELVKWESGKMSQRQDSIMQSPPSSAEIASKRLRELKRRERGAKRKQGLRESKRRASSNGASSSILPTPVNFKGLA